MSEYDRRIGIKHLRVRGLKAVRFCAKLKALAVTIFRAAAVQKAANPDQNDQKRTCVDLNHIVFIIKEHFVTTMRHLENFMNQYAANYV